jgi:hypothetical protein
MQDAAVQTESGTKAYSVLVTGTRQHSIHEAPLSFFHSITDLSTI